MPHRIAHKKENDAKRRSLIWLSTTSSALIIVMWIFYMQYAFTAPQDDTNASQTTFVSIFKTGIATIKNTIETGLVNSYLYFHTVASEEKTFTITK